MHKKTLGILAVILIIIGIAGLVLSSGYSGLTYRGYPAGYSPQLGGYGGIGPGGMMGGGMMGGGPNPGDAWALNDEAIKNLGYMQLKKTHDAAMVIMERVYGERPRFNYFIGGSQGGREALTVAQRYPADYDGIIADVPIVNFSSGSSVGGSISCWSAHGFRHPSSKPCLTAANAS